MESRVLHQQLRDDFVVPLQQETASAIDKTCDAACSSWVRVGKGAASMD
jgi:hypothetical protein